MHGYNVFFPIGFDAFGLPAENAAIKSGGHPFDWTMAQHREHAPPVAARWARRSAGSTRSSPPTRTTTAGTSGCSCASWRTGLAYRAKSAGRLVPQRRHPGARAGRGRGAALLAVRRAGREARARAVVPARRPTTRTSCCRSSGIDWPGADPHPADQLDRPVRGRRDRLRDRPVRPSRRRRDHARVHDAARTRCSAPRSWCSLRSTRWSPALTAPDRRAEVEAYVGAGAAPDRDRPPVDRPREDRRRHRRRRDQPGQRRADPDLRRRLRAGRLRDRRDHGRPRPRRA